MRKAMNDVMIDIETLGNGSRAVIVSIAAVAFDIETGQVDSKAFYQTVDIQSCLDAKLEVNGSTISWWLQQSMPARSVFSEDNVPLHEALMNLIGFLKKYPNANVWGNGSRFDLGILSDAYRACNLPIPWDYRNERDVRTLVSLRPHIKHELPFYGTRHNPVDDCVHQIRYCSTIWKLLNSNA